MTCLRLENPGLLLQPTLHRSEHARMKIGERLRSAEVSLRPLTEYQGPKSTLPNQA